MNLRKFARDKECQVRSPVCNFDSATTVLAHLNHAGLALKKNDLLAAHCCFDCHDFVDNRRFVTTQIERDFYLLQGVARTIEFLLEQGHVRVG